jgi:hypothetical protein
VDIGAKMYSVNLKTSRFMPPILLVLVSGYDIFICDVCFEAAI